MAEATRFTLDEPFDPAMFAGSANRNQRRSGSTPKQQGPFFAYSGDAWAEPDLEPRPWIAIGYLLRRSLSVLVGPGASGKSSLMVAWTIALALGTTFGRLRPRQACRVMVVNAEDDDQEQRRRFSAALRSMGRSPTDLIGQVLRVAPVKDAPLFRRHEDGTIGPTSAYDELLARIEDFEPDVLLLDPLISLHVEDENSNEAMQGVVAGLRELARNRNMAVLVAHHTRKGMLTPGDIDSARGASAVKDLARIALTLVVMSEEDASAFGIPRDQRHSFFRVDDAKSNYAPIQSAEWFERCSHHLDNGDHVACCVPWTPPQDVVSLDTRVAVLDALALGTGDGPYSPKLDGSPRSFRALCTGHGITTHSGQRALLDELLATGGYTVRRYRKPSNSGIVHGIRCPDGSPRSTAWIDEPGGGDL